MQLRYKYQNIKSDCNISLLYKIRISGFVVSIFLAITLVVLPTSCKKLVEVDSPVTSTNSANVYATDATAAAVLTGIYSDLSKNPLSAGGITSISFFTGLSADELTLYSAVPTPVFFQYYKNALIASNTGIYPWDRIYPTVFVTNAAIEGLTRSTSLTPAVRQQLIGEAKFMRAFCYFYLVNLYGDVLLALNTDYTVNATLPRAPKVQVWQQIIADLKDAQTLLNTNYLKADVLATTSERVRPTKWAAIALLAKAYLYTGDHVNAEAQATMVINNSSQYSLSTLNNVFLKNSNEAIWQLQPVNSGWNTEDARTFIIPATGPSGTYPVYLSNNLLNSFELGDQRKLNWVGSVTPTPPGTTTYYYPYKYQATTSTGSASEYLMVLRLGEQYLIRAEARVQQNNISGAQSDLNMIRTRAGLANATANDKASLLTAILHERQVELFTEWGHRWLDMKRTNTVDAVMNVVAPQKGGTWNTNWQFYPIPLIDIQRNPNLVQNTGY